MEFRQARHPTFWVCEEGCKSGCGAALASHSHCSKTESSDGTTNGANGANLTDSSNGCNRTNGTNGVNTTNGANGNVETKFK